MATAIPANPSQALTSCPLCQPTGEDVLWQNQLCRVVLVGDPNYPGFCRVILNRHAREMTDLSTSERSLLMAVVFRLEAVLRDLLNPTKVNLASFGNIVPHVHWHVIPRFEDDLNFPEPNWGKVTHPSAVPVPLVRDVLLARVQTAMDGVELTA